MRTIVERLRGDLPGRTSEKFALMREAADEIERLRDENHEFREEIVRLADMKANLHGHIKRLEDENSDLKQRGRTDDECDEAFRALQLRIKTAERERDNWADDWEFLRAENAKLREALEEIAHMPIDIDAPHYPVSLALAALAQKDEGE